MPHNLALLNKLAQPQKNRLIFIDFRLFFLGELRRSDIVDRFSTGGAGATRDIALYREIAPNNCIFDIKSKVYRIGDEFSPIFDHPISQALVALSQGFGDIATSDSDRERLPLVRCAYPTLLSAPKVEVLSAITRAIHRGVAVGITYYSAENGESTREIVPFALVSNGIRWHVRAFDRKRERFIDVILTRIHNPVVKENDFAQAREKPENDVQWSRIIELELRVNPKVRRPDVIAMDYPMVNGIMKVRVRASDAGYLLRLWNVDCSSKHEKSDPLVYVLCLHDPLVLHAAESAIHAPYYEDQRPK